MRPDPRTSAMTEAQLQEAVRQNCIMLGLFHFHVLNSKGCEPGWPDSVIIGRRILYRELKSQHGTLTSEQRAVGYKLQAAGGNWKVWRPADWFSGQIAAELTEIAGVQQKLWEESA